VSAHISQSVRTRPRIVLAQMLRRLGIQRKVKMFAAKFKRTFKAMFNDNFKSGLSNQFNGAFTDRFKTAFNQSLKPNFARHFNAGLMKRINVTAARGLGKEDPDHLAGACNRTAPRADPLARNDGPPSFVSARSEVTKRSSPRRHTRA
jgi:hypothetical protein